LRLASTELRGLIDCQNIWLGVSVENRSQGLPRINYLRSTPASTRFLSIEPLLENLGELDLEGIDWVIVGGESGAKARPMSPEWVRSIRDQCIAKGTRFFFKQWGGARPKSGGRLLEGEEWNAFPSRIVPKAIMAALSAS
jgi:protein gp37